MLFKFSRFKSFEILIPAYFKAVKYKGSLIPHFFNKSLFNKSLGAPLKIISPSLSKTILSKFNFKISSSLCSIMIIVLFVLCVIVLINSIVFSEVFGSTLASGSSNNKISISSTIAPPRVTFCY